MDPQPQKERSLRFDFSQQEGQQLCALLEHLLTMDDSTANIDVIEAVYDKVAGANWLAAWKRENVMLELSIDEIMHLNKALHDAGGSQLAKTFNLTGELCCCLITTPLVDRAYAPRT